MSTLIISLVSALIIAVIVGIAIMNVRKGNAKQLAEYVKDHDFISKDGRIRGHVKQAIFDSIVIDGIPYGSMEEVFSDVILSKTMFRQLRSMQREMTKLRRDYIKNTVNPLAYQEFKETPIGSVRIYKEGAVSISPKLNITIGKDHEGRLIVGRAIMSKKDLLADSYWVDFKMSNQCEGVTEKEVEANLLAFKEHLSSKAFRKENANLRELERHLALSNKHKFELIQGKLIFNGLEPSEVITHTIALPSSASRKKRQDEQAIINARRNK
jgi:hypothetical protein